MNQYKAFFKAIFLAILFLPVLLWAQESELSGTNIVPEKVYLQLSSKVYTTNETIWFKSIIVNATFHEPTRSSGVLYVQLINSEEEVVDGKTVKIADGIGSSFFELKSSYDEGTYLIRAYTEWNKNFDSDFIFEEYIQLFDPKKDKTQHPISNLTIKSKLDKSKWLQANIDPFVLDSLHKKKVLLYVTSEDKQDSLTLKKNDDGIFRFEHSIADTTQFVTLRIKTKNAISSPKTIVVDQDYLDFQFFPESGDLVHGITSKVGFKALNANGKGKEISGVIVNEAEEHITSFKSNSLGMGSFLIQKADSSTSYFAKITSQIEKDLQIKFPLPKVNSMGNVLSVLKRNGKIVIRVASNYMDSDSIYMKVSARGLDYFEIKGRLKNGVLKSSLMANKLPEGILAITLMDKNKVTMAERLYFNQKSEDRVQISVETNKKNYEQRELTTLNIKTTDSKNTPAYADISVLVLNKEQMGEMQHRRQNILSYFLLSSDIKGYVERPGYYFQKDSIRHQDLDNLLLTQGWSKYNYITPIKDLIYQSEEGLSISGDVTSLFSQKRKKVVNLSLMTVGKPNTFDAQTTDSLGRFKFDLEDSYVERLKVLIQSADTKGKNKNFTVSLDKKESPHIDFMQEKLIQQVDSVINEYVEMNMERNRIDDMFELSSDVNQLDEVEITAYKMTPQRTKVQKEHGDPDIVIKGKEIQAKEEKWSYGLYSVIMFHYPDKIRVIEVRNNLYAQVIGSPTIGPGDGVTLVVVDGIPVMKENYPLISSIPPSEVSSFEIIRSANGFFKLFMQVFPRVHPLDAPKFGSVIAIYTHAGKGLLGVQKPVGLLHTTVPVFSPTKEFYSPKYENLSAGDWLKPDLRALVHWKPTVPLDSLGNASTSFYNSDNLGETMVIIEAISKNGEIGYKEFIYNVEKVATGY